MPLLILTLLGCLLSLWPRAATPAEVACANFPAGSLALTAQQKERLARMRSSNPSDPKGPFLYSTPITMPKIENTDFLFGVR